MIEPSGSDVEISVDSSTQCGFMVDWGLFVLAARWSAAFPFLFASPASVVAAFRPCGPALSPESWRHPGYFSYCCQPCVIGSLAYGVCKTLRVLVTPCWSYMKGDLSKHAAACAAAVLFPVFLKVCLGALTVTSLV